MENQNRYQWAAIINERYTGLVAFDGYCVEVLNEGIFPRCDWVFVGDMPEHVMIRRVTRGCRASVLRARYDWT